MNDKSEGSIQKTSKIAIFAKNKKGYEKLIKIYSISSKIGFYYQPRIDYKTLRENWSNDLILIIPFYDSFIYNNTLRNYICVPQIDFTKPYLFIEDNDLPFDGIIKEKIKTFAKENSLDILNVKSIFYNRKKDFKTYLTFRCINNRSALNKPEIEHMTSNEFCFESFLSSNKE
jgi:DNA polymerase III alpha subunit